MIQYIRKRDGRMDRFDVNKIAGAIYKAFQATDAKYDWKDHWYLIAFSQDEINKKYGLIQNPGW